MYLQWYLMERAQQPFLVVRSLTRNSLCLPCCMEYNTIERQSLTYTDNVVMTWRHNSERTQKHKNMFTNADIYCQVIFHSSISHRGSYSQCHSYTTSGVQLLHSTCVSYFTCPLHDCNNYFLDPTLTSHNYMYIRVHSCACASCHNDSIQLCKRILQLSCTLCKANKNHTRYTWFKSYCIVRLQLTQYSPTSMRNCSALTLSILPTNQLEDSTGSVVDIDIIAGQYVYYTTTENTSLSHLCYNIRSQLATKAISCTAYCQYRESYVHCPCYDFVRLLEAMVMVAVFMHSCGCYADLAFRLQQIDGASFRIGSSLTQQRSSEEIKSTSAYCIRRLYKAL